MRRVARGLACALLLAVPGVAWAREGNERYVGDVEFLLTNLPKKAGHFFAAKGVDWKRVSAQFRDEVLKVTTDAEHVTLCGRLLARLRDGQAAIVDAKAKPVDESKGRPFTGPRVHLLVAGDKVHVRASFGQAADLGIGPGMEVLAIDKIPARKWLADRVEVLRDRIGFSTDAQALYAACHLGLADWEGTPIAFEFATGGERKKVTLTRNGGPNYAPLGAVFPPRDAKALGRQSYAKTESGFAYVRLGDAPQDLPDQLDAILEAVGDAPGLVLDMRANSGGGCDPEAVFGRFLAAGETWRQYKGQGKRPFPGPMVVIVDAGVVSAGETLAGMFKEDGRAYLIGEGPTAGMSSQKETLAVPSGLFTVRFSVKSDKARFNDGKGIEGVGVAPHEVVPYDPADLARAIDTQIRRAEEILRKGPPPGSVAYEPPKPK